MVHCSSGSSGSGGGAAAFAGSWNLSGTETFSSCVGAVASASKSAPFSAELTWTAGGPGLIGNSGGCSFDDSVSGDTATLEGSPSCTGPAAGGAEAQTTFNTFTWVLDAGGTTATISQTGTQNGVTGDGETWSCEVTYNLTATKE
jgi:hypothetical protein